VIPPASPPVAAAGATLRLGDQSLDLAARVLVAGVVPAPRFGREAEVQAAAGAVLALGADLVDVPPPSRIAGVARGTAGRRVAVRAASPGEVAQARAAGVEVIMVPRELAAGLVGDSAPAGQQRGESLGAPGPVGPVGPVGLVGLVVVVGDPADVAAARADAERWGLPLAFDAIRWSGAAATAREAAAVAGGCRLLRTTDVRRSRRVAEVTGALLAARRPDAPGGGRDLEEHG
jgi:hypothetical protein